MSKTQNAYEKMISSGKIKPLPKIQENLSMPNKAAGSSATIEILAEKINSFEKRLQLLESTIIKN